METVTEDQVNTETNDEVVVSEIEIESEDVTEAQSQNEVEIPSILRTSMNGCFEIYKGVWGSYLRRAADPDANVVITDEHYEKFELNPEIHRIPSDLWQRWVQLCFHFVDKVTSSVEVSIRILRSEEDPSQYRFLVPKQKVSAATVRVETFDEAIDIETGEKIESYPPVGWIPVGSSHSHNTMGAFFSGTDDKYELGDPGIHLVVGSVNTTTKRYAIAASVVGNGRRFELEYKYLIDATPVEGVSFHPDVLEYIDYTSPLTTYTGAYTGNYTSTYNKKWSNNYNKTNTKSYDDHNLYDQYCDPYWYSENANDVYGWSEYFQARYGEAGTQVVTKTPLKLHNVEDILIDFQADNENKLEEMIKLMHLLRDYADDIEQHIEKTIASYQS